MSVAVPSLIEKAMAAVTSDVRGRKIQKWSLEDRLELAIAYAEKRITSGQVRAAFGKNQVTSPLGSTLLTAARAGLIRIKRVPK